jgi:hypothetical protein
METARNNVFFQPSDQGLIHQAMIPAVLVLSLLALLVATDPEPVAAPVHPAPEPPLRPDRNHPAGDKVPASDQIAA